MGSWARSLIHWRSSNNPSTRELQHQRTQVALQEQKHKLDMLWDYRGGLKLSAMARQTEPEVDIGRGFTCMIAARGEKLVPDVGCAAVGTQ